MNQVKVIAFDADDTLWDNQPYYDKVEEVFISILRRFGEPQYISDRLYEVESGNMSILGYGAKAVCISMMETALALSNNTISPDEMAKIVSNAKSLLSIPASPIQGVVETLEKIRNEKRWRMILLTKGDVLDQQNKIDRSGLGKFFDRIVIVSTKGEAEYLNLCKEEQCKPEELMMVGNSFKSDIEPAVAVGCKAVHIPYHTMWRHELTEEFEHPNITRLKSFTELPELLAPVQ